MFDVPRCNNSASLAGIPLEFPAVPQGGTGLQPKVGARRLPWVTVAHSQSTPTGLWPIPGSKPDWRNRVAVGYACPPIIAGQLRGDNPGLLAGIPLGFLFYRSMF